MDGGIFEDIIRSAIQSEEEAFRFYRDASGKLSDTSIKELFSGFAAEEKKHAEALQKALDDGLFKLNFRGASDYRVSETVTRPVLSTEMKPVDAIALAMKKEEDAMKKYTELAHHSVDENIHKLFLDLAKMEREHKFKLEKIFTDMAYPEAW